MSSMSGTATVHLSERELRLIRNALRTYLNDFGHKEAAIVAEARSLLARLPDTVNASPVDS
jgi:hypothetical protein